MHASMRGCKRERNTKRKKKLAKKEDTRGRIRPKKQKKSFRKKKNSRKKKKRRKKIRHMETFSTNRLSNLSHTKAVSTHSTRISQDDSTFGSKKERRKTKGARTDRGNHYFKRSTRVLTSVRISSVWKESFDSFFCSHAFWPSVGSLFLSFCISHKKTDTNNSTQS